MSQHSAKGKTWEQQRQRVLARDGWRCTRCHKELIGGDATVDHVSPISLSDSKTYDDSELIAMCRACNSRKGDKILVRLDYRNPSWF